jgi:hypothetical protein
VFYNYVKKKRVIDGNYYQTAVVFAFKVTLRGTLRSHATTNSEAVIHERKISTAGIAKETRANRIS